MARFYGNSPLFPQLPAAPATVPIFRQSAVVPPQAMPAGSIIQVPDHAPSPFMIHPEIIGALPQKQIVPPLFDEKTAASLIRGQFVDTVPVNPVDPRGAMPLAPPSPVFPFFTTSASNALQRAVSADYKAQDARARAAELQAHADLASHAAQRAASNAQIDPSPTNVGLAKAAEKTAQQTDDAAARAHAAAEHHDQKADDAAEHAQVAADKEAAAQHARDVANDEAIARGDSKSVNPGVWYTDDQFPLQLPPGVLPGLPLPPGWVTPASGGAKHPVLYAGGAAVAGFVLGGPIGALVGAVGGYLFGNREPASAQMHPADVPPVIYSGGSMLGPDGKPLLGPDGLPMLYVA